MKFLGFYPESVAARARAAGVPARTLTLAQSLGLGAGGFCGVSMLVIAVAAFADNSLRKYLGPTGSYVVYDLMVILMAGAVFRQLIIAPHPAFRAYVLFGAAFFLYYVTWAAAFRPFQNLLGEWLGALAGGIGLGLVFATVFDAPKQALRSILILCVASAAGYFGGKFLRQFFPGRAGALVWGAVYGLGMGTGLGYALYACQEPARQRLKTLSDSRSTAALSRPIS
jgi:hypothetical protein